MITQSLVWLFPLVFPFASFVLLFLHGPFFSNTYSQVLKKAFTGLSVLGLVSGIFLSFFFFIELRTLNVVTELDVAVFFNSHPGSLPAGFALLNTVWLFNAPFVAQYLFLVDSITITMLFVVLGVSAAVQLFSTEYMIHDLLLIRFFMFLNFFTLCMLVLVTAGTFVQMFIGWEGVGLASFFLIGFWLGRKQAVKCALKAIIINRVGDCALLFSFALIAFLFGDVSYSFVFSTISNELVPFFEIFQHDEVLSSSFVTNRTFWFLLQPLTAVELIAMLLCIGAFAKSAQFGLHTWLPDAMEGPTPVSALIHAATMVTAGVFLLVRTGPLIALSSSAQNCLIFLGSLTAFFGASTAFAQFDIKKIIAYSTCSQLGYMVAACGLLSFDLALFHLTTHALFKAGLFMCAGLIIHALNNEQDIRRFGGLITLMPFTYFAMLLCSCCLGGLPFFAGYFSKDAIMELAFGFDRCFWLAFFLLILAACFTVLYSLRLFFYVFWRPFAGARISLFLIHETPRSVFAVLILSFFSIFLGFFFKQGLYTKFYDLSAFGENLIEQIKFNSILDVWETPFFSVSEFFYLNCDLFALFHEYLPATILFVLGSCFVFGVTYISQQFFYKSKIVLLELFCKVFIIFRHFFAFFSRAWLFDVFLTKMARVFFKVNKTFVVYQIESGAFEFFLVLWLTRLVNRSSISLAVLQSTKLSLFFEASIITTVFLGLAVIVLIAIAA
jgi:NADH-quinone oxidoreductase subunit L